MRNAHKSRRFHSKFRNSPYSKLGKIYSKSVVAAAKEHPYRLLGAAAALSTVSGLIIWYRYKS